MLDFDLLASGIGIRMAGHGPEIKQLIEAGFAFKDNVERDGCLLNTMHHHMLTSPGPGELIDEILLAQLTETAKGVREVANEGLVDLFIWVRQTISMASMLAMYGPKHIFGIQPDLEGFLWQYESNLTPLMANFMPSLFVPTAYAARERIKKALVEYAEKDYDKQASKVIQRRAKIHIDKGLGFQKAAELEIALVHGIMVGFS